MGVRDEEERDARSLSILSCRKSPSLRNPALPDRAVTEDSHYFSWEGMMSLFIRYRCIPLYFRLYITFPPSRIPQPRNAPVQPPARHSRAFAIARSPRSPSLTPLIRRTIGPALRMGCTGDRRTSLLHFPFRTGPHVVFLMIISFSDLLIRHRDMRQFPPVTRLAPTRADRFQVIAPRG